MGIPVTPGAWKADYVAMYVAKKKRDNKGKGRDNKEHSPIYESQNLGSKKPRSACQMLALLAFYR